MKKLIIAAAVAVLPSIGCAQAQSNNTPSRYGYECESSGCTLQCNSDTQTQWINHAEGANGIVVLNHPNRNVDYLVDYGSRGKKTVSFIRNTTCYVVGYRDIRRLPD